MFNVWKSPRKIIFAFFLFATLVIIYDQIDSRSSGGQGISCFWSLNNGSLPSISHNPPTDDESIFFHETSCNAEDGYITINPRQACAVESAARMNPNKNVYLMFASPGDFPDKFETESERILKQLRSYKNVRIVHLDVREYIRGTPLEDILERLSESRYPESHASDVLRYLTLWKYGGIYMDLDVIVIKSLENLPQNYAGMESEKNVAAGIMSFDLKSVGRRFANDCVFELKKNFDGRDWGSNGPGVITRLLKKNCKNISADSKWECNGFTVYPKNVFYPIQWEQWYKYFDGRYGKEVNKAVESSYIIHVWNKHSISTKLPLDSDAPYLQFAQRYCPKVVYECDSYF